MNARDGLGVGRAAGRLAWAALLVVTVTVGRAHDVVVAIASPTTLVEKFVDVMHRSAPDAGIPAYQSLLEGLRAGPLAGIDLDRPIGFFGSAPETAGGQQRAALAIPITSIDELLNALRGVGASVERERQEPGFTHRVSTPLLGGFPLFLTASRDYAYLTPFPVDAEALQRTRLEDWVPDRADAGDVSFTLRIDELPQELADMLVAQFESQAAEQEEQAPGEDEWSYRGRIVGQRLAFRGMTRLVRDGQTLSIDLTIDRDADAIVAAGRLSARPGSPMAAALTAFDRIRSRFSALAPESPLVAWMALPVPVEFRDLIMDAFVRGLTESAPETAAERRLMRDMLAIAEGMIRQEVQDIGVAMMGPTPRTETYALAMAAGIVDGRKADSLFERLVETTQDEGVQTRAGRARDGTALHRIRVTDQEGLTPVFGDAAGWVGFHDDCIAVALGDTTAGQAAADRVLAAADGGATSDAPIGAVIRVASLAPLTHDAAIIDVAEEMFADANAGRDRVRMLLGGRRGDLRLTLTIDMPIVAFLVRAGERAGVEAVGAP